MADVKALTDYEKFRTLFKEIGCKYLIHLEPDRIYIAIDPILADGDLGVEFDRKGKFKKICDGVKQMGEMKTTFIKKTIITKSRKQKIGQRVEFGFDAPIDWTPGKGTCWIDCPFSVCTSLGHRCKALVDNLCPFTKNTETYDYNVINDINDELTDCSDTKENEI